jgi:hypothetical protein
MWSAWRGFGAVAASVEGLSLANAAARQAALVRRLARFSFPAIAEATGGLLTEPANQPATFRLEVLATLAALHASGDRKPNSEHLRDWLNGPLLHDDIGQLEDPVEDVFVSNVPSPSGNLRLFDGLWGVNDVGVRALLQAVLQLGDRPWAAGTLESCMGLLQLSELVAERASIPRYAVSPGRPRQPIRIVTRNLDAARARVVFTVDDLHSLGLRAAVLKPFVFMDEHRAALVGQGLGHTALERRPLVWNGTAMVVALPTAIGAAVRRLILERAQVAGDLAAVEGLVADLHLSELINLGMPGLRATPVRPPQPLVARCRDFVAQFDEGGFLHVVHAGEDMTDVLNQGLRSLQRLPSDLPPALVTAATGLTADAGYRRGLTVVVHSSVGRGFATMLPESFGDWHFTGIEQSDLARMWLEDGFDALRLWKMLDQDARLPSRGYGIRNVNGLPNLYGFMRENAMAIVPDGAAAGDMELATDFVAGVRQRLRGLIDAHVARKPGRGGWLEVQRTTLDVFFGEVERLPLYASVADAAAGRPVSCVETPTRPWWVSLARSATSPTGRSVEFQIWDAAQNWMVRAAPRLETLLPAIPAGPIDIRISVPGADALGAGPPSSDAPYSLPSVTIDVGGAVIEVSCGADHLQSFGRAENLGERLLVAAIVRGAAALSGTALADDAVEAVVMEVVGSVEARFFHMIPPRTPSTLIYAAAGLGRPRLLQDEDVAWSRLGLAQAAGWTSGSGPLSAADAPVVLNAAVEAIWSRVRPLMQTLDREDLAVFALGNHDRVAWNRMQWAQTASALLALYSDQGDVVAAFNRLESQRGMASLSSRVIAEMAVCTSPEAGGRKVTKADFDAMLADIGVLIECANQSDAIRWGLAGAMPVVNPNGSLSFDRSFQESQQRPYIDAHGERDFRDAAGSYRSYFAAPGASGGLRADPTYLAAIEGEYAVGLEGLARLAAELANEAAAAGTNVLRLPRSEVVARIAGKPADAPAIDAARCYDALALIPRASWDEPAPAGAKQRDWYPWRFNRRLSLLQRPLLQVGTGGDPLVLVHPTLLDHFIQRLFLVKDGLLPVELYSTEAMRSWIGTAVNREGHAFNHRVAAELAKVGWKTRPDVKLTQLGGTQELGDVDVLAWHSATGLVLAIECKRLQKARSIGEIGERLHEYATLAAAGAKRTPIQKHLDRLAFLRANPAGLAKLSAIPVDRLQLRSALVTDHLVPMQFSAKAAALVDRIVEFRSIAAALEPAAMI